MDSWDKSGPHSTWRLINLRLRVSLHDLLGPRVGWAAEALRVYSTDADLADSVADGTDDVSTRRKR